jgi:hypothetical protein
MDPVASSPEPNVLSVHSALRLKQGGVVSGPSFDVHPIKQLQGGTLLWEAWPTDGSQGFMEVNGPKLEAEPPLFLAARAAWELWGNEPSCIEQPDFDGMSLQVDYDAQTMAAIAMVVDSRGATYTGWTLSPVLRLEFRTTDGPYSRDPQHWLSQIMTLIAFGSRRPPDVSDGATKLRSLPSFWKPGYLPRDVQDLPMNSLQPELCGHHPFTLFFEYERQRWPAAP